MGVPCLCLPCSGGVMNSCSLDPAMLWLFSVLTDQGIQWGKMSFKARDCSGVWWVHCQGHFWLKVPELVWL